MAINEASSRSTAVRTEVRAPAEVVVSRIIWFVFGAIEVVIAIRFALLLFGANAQAAFVKLVYGLSDVFMSPFAAVFPTDKVSGAVFEWSALLAIAIYALVGWGLTALIAAVVPREHAETVRRVEAEEDISSTDSV
ncbi:hypothetical protein EG835_13535 [bacterium]|nr:hypothetical protein [bacterium]